MGELFPGDLEYPDHKPIPSPIAEAVTPTVTAAVITVGLAALCPVLPPRGVSIHEHEHVPHHEFIDTRPVVSINAFGSSSSSGDDLSWMNNRRDIANDIVRRHWTPQQAAHMMIAASSSTMSAALLNFVSTSAGQP